MVRRREQVSDSQRLTDRLKMFGRKLLAIVGQKEDRRAVREDQMVQNAVATAWAVVDLSGTALVSFEYRSVMTSKFS